MTTYTVNAVEEDGTTRKFFQSTDATVASDFAKRLAFIYRKVTVTQS